MSPASAGADRAAARFFEAMIENRFGMRCRPAVGQHFFQTLGVAMKTDQKIANVGPRFQMMTLGPGQDRGQHGGSWPRSCAA